MVHTQINALNHKIESKWIHIVMRSENNNMKKGGAINDSNGSGLR